jgi:hypothetical protein
MRRGAELLAVLLFVLGGRKGERVDRSTFAWTSRRAPRDPPSRSSATPAEEESAVCAEIRRAPEIYFPEQSDLCSIPVDYLYAMLRGTFGGEELQQTLSCSDTDRRAIRAWSELLGYEPPRRDRN